METKTKTKKVTLSRTDYPVVNSLDNLEVGRIYTTTNHSIFTPLKYNRGVKEGYVVGRVNKFKKMIKDGEFLFHVPHGIINLAGYIVDGNNKIKALEQLNLPVNFMITAEPKFNVKNPSEILNNVSEFNSTNGSWSTATNYKSALAFKEPVAVAIDKLLQKLYNDYNMPKKNVLVPSRIVGLAMHSKVGVRQNKTRRTYCDMGIANKINSPEFGKEVEFMMKVMQFVKVDNPNIKVWDVLKSIMPLIWDYELSLNIVLRNMKKRGFKDLANNKIATILARCKEIAQMGNVK